MKRFLALTIISLLVLGACSPKEEAKETNIETSEKLPVNEDKDMDNTSDTNSNMDNESTSDEEMLETSEEDAVINEDSDDIVQVEGSGLLELTLEELKTYDGTNGNPAYIAIDGKIYDVSVIPNWDGGSHHGFKAGNDLTKEMKEISPHGVSKLQFVEEVGIIVE